MAIKVIRNLEPLDAELEGVLRFEVYVNIGGRFVVAIGPNRWVIQPSNCCPYCYVEALVVLYIGAGAKSKNFCSTYRTEIYLGTGQVVKFTRGQTSNPWQLTCKTTSKPAYRRQSCKLHVT
jgi:hypothetical protein